MTGKKKTSTRKTHDNINYHSEIMMLPIGLQLSDVKHHYFDLCSSSKNTGIDDCLSTYIYTKHSSGQVQSRGRNKSTHV